ncbi:MAG: PAS domain S-box protein [Bacteroidetes bacterium]|nr:PAS domain S-box protein [Bacteroidota bacterium]
MNFLVNSWNKLSLVGIPEDIGTSELKRIKLTNRFGVIAVFFTLPYIFGFFYFGFNNLGYLLCLLSIFYVSTIYFNYLKLYNGAKMILYITVLIHQFIVASAFGEAAEVHLMYMALLLLPVVLCDHKKDFGWIIFYITLTAVAIAILYITHFSLFAIDVPDSFIRMLNIAYKITTLTGVVVILLATTAVADRTERVLDEDKLLLENQLAVIFDNSFDAIFLVDAKARKIIKANKRAAELFEMDDADDFIGLMGITFHKDVATEEFVNNMQLSLITKGDFETEVLYRTKKGNKFWGALAIRIINIHGKPYQSVRITDVSSQKKIEKQIQASLHEKEILLAEIHHRVKNNLAVISGLLGLQASYLEDEHAKKLFEESRNRIHSMALIHDKLYRHETLSEINFCSYINDLVNHIKGSYISITTDIHFSITCNDIFLDIKNAVPCGLILNELISNSCKHAFKGKSEGEIQIVCTKMGEKFTMMVRDNGVGCDLENSIKDPKSLGLTLVSALIGQVSGSVKTTCDGGTAYYISFEP